MTPASRPLRAMRGGGVVLAVLVAWRVPTIERTFAAALAAGRRGAARPAIAWQSGPPLPPAGASVAAVAPGGSGAAARALVTVAASGAAPLAASGPARLATGRVPSSPTLPTPPVDGSPAPDAGGGGPLPLPRDALAAADPLATAAYARLAAGDRRGAVRLFDAALLIDDPRAPAWRRQRDALRRRWSATAYSIVRASGPPPTARSPVTPVLGGGQSGVALAFAPDPLAPRPLALTLRGSVAHDDAGRTGFAAAGVQWRPATGVTIAAERLIAVGPAARGAWTVRVAGGVDRTAGRWRVAAYGEAGVVGDAGYAAAEARAGPVLHDRGLAVEPSLGAWASVQHGGGRPLDRLDAGPGVVARAGALAVALDWRFRLAGDAAPGSGPVATLSAAF